MAQWNPRCAMFFFTKRIRSHFFGGGKQYFRILYV